MAENGRIVDEEGEEHEEGEISDEDPPPPSSGIEEQVESAREEVSEGVEAATVAPPSKSDRYPPLLQRRAGLADLKALGSELRVATAQTRKRADAYQGRGRELGSSNEEDGGNNLERNGWGTYGSSLYNFAWAQAVSSRSSLTSTGSSLTINTSPTPSGGGLSSSGSRSLGAWSTESNKKLSREFSRDLDFYGRSAGRSSEERDDMSPLRENVSKASETLSSDRDTTGRGRRIRETSWAERPKTVKSRIEKSERGRCTEDYHRGQLDGEEVRSRKQKSESPSTNGRLNELESGGRSSSDVTVQLGHNGDDNGEADDREEGELEEGEIELGSISAQKPTSPSKEQPDSTRQHKSNGPKAVDYWPKDKAYARSLSSKSHSRYQTDDYSSRRHRQAKIQESHREKRLSVASDLVKNVTVKDAQKSFVDVCGRLHKALRVLDELHTPRQAEVQEGRLENLPREITALARQAFAGIRAVYAVRNTASGREQERDKNIFPRLLELANGYCQKLFTPKQTRELEVMMQTIANAGRVIKDDSEKGQYPRVHQYQPASKKSNDNNTTSGNSLGNNVGIVKLSDSTEPKASSESSIAGRILGVVDAKQAEEAAAIAAAALAYAQSSAAARANTFFGSSYDNRSTGPSVQGTGAWGWISENSSQVQFNDPGVNSLQPNNNVYNPAAAKYQLWNETEQQPNKLGHLVEVKALDTLAGGSTPRHSTKEDLIAPPGYSKASDTPGVLEDDWEELSPPGAGISSYVPVPAAPVQTIGVQKESAQDKVWPSMPEISTGLAYQKNRGSTPQYSAELQLNPNQQRSRAAASMYSIERLPSPTPDEDEDASVETGLSVPATKPGLLDVGTKESSVLKQPQRVGKLPSSISLAGAVHNLIRSQSLDGPGSVIEPKLQQEKSGEMMLPLAAGLSDRYEYVQNSTSLPPIGMFRSRDPRRRFQNHSLDMTDIGGMDLSSQVISGPNLNLGEVHTPGIDKSMKRYASEFDDNQDFRNPKRLKGQSDSVHLNNFHMDSLRDSSGTGGWLDDNVVSSCATIGELPMAMEVDEEGPFTALESGQEIGSDVNVDLGGQLDAYPDLVNSMVMNKEQRVDLGQQNGENGHRKMKLRDPRRVFVESHVERSDNSSGDMLRADGMVTVTARKDEDPVVRSTAEVAPWNKELTQGSKQGGSLQCIAPHYMEKLASIPGMVSSSLSVTKSDQLVNSGDGLVLSGPVTNKSVGEDSVDVKLVAVPNESVSEEVPEHQKDKFTGLNIGPWKAKGGPSQWGASQVHPGLEQLLGDLSEQERRLVQLERMRRMEEQDRMFSAGKLCLVLDLDHTLLNSAKFSEIEQEWDQRLRVAETAERNRAGRDGKERRELYRFPHMSMWTKLRPGIWKFLARASQLYELHVYTMGNKVYATEMAKLLDPTGKLFAGRVISKGDDGDGDDILPKSKDLDGVLGMESAVVIIDDSARVWPHHSENLIVVERYMYFPCSRRQFGLAGPSLLEVGHDERESDGMLASALGVIDRIHQSFFNNPRLREVDVREILAAQQRQVLAGCKVVFSRVFPVGEAEPHRHPLWRTAEQFGAICTITIDDHVTHVVAISLGTDKVNWALETGRSVVRPAWLEASTILYRRANERDFPVLPQ